MWLKFLLPGIGNHPVVRLKQHFLCIVPVDIWTSTTLPPPMIEDETDMTAMANLPMSTNPGGCDIDGQFYMDGMKV